MIIVISAFMPRVQRLVTKFGVLLCEDVASEGGIAFGFLSIERRLVGGFLLGGECLDSRDDGGELLVGSDLIGRIGFLGEVARVADPSGTQGLATFLEIGVRVRTDFSVVVVHHVNRLILSPSS